MVVPEGFGLPPPVYAIGLSLAVGVLALVLVRLDPEITPSTVVALVPWMALGGALHALYVRGIVNPAFDPLLGTPAVYATTAILIGIAWILAVAQPGNSAPVPWVLGLTGAIAFGISVIVIVREALARDVLALGWPLIGVFVSVVLTAMIWYTLCRVRADVATTTGWAGMIMVFGHVLDGVSTTIGVDILGAGERSPIPLLIMDVAGVLPAADIIGVGWAFVLVKVALAALILWLFVDFVRETPRQAYLILALLAAVGLGPGIHNLLLFTMSG